MGPSTNSFNWAVFFVLSAIVGVALLAVSYTRTGAAILLGAGLLTFLHFLSVFVERRARRNRFQEEAHRLSARQLESLENLNTAERTISNRKD